MRKDYVNRESLYLCLCASVRVRQYFVWRLHCITLSFVRLHVCLVNTKWSDKDEIVVLERRRRREKTTTRKTQKAAKMPITHSHTKTADDCFVYAQSQALVVCNGANSIFTTLTTHSH